MLSQFIDSLIEAANRGQSVVPFDRDIPGVLYVIENYLVDFVDYSIDSNELRIKEGMLEDVRETCIDFLRDLDSE